MREALLLVWFALFATAAVIAAYWLFRLIVASSHAGVASGRSQRSVGRRFAAFGIAALGLGLGFVAAVALW